LGVDATFFANFDKFVCIKRYFLCRQYMILLGFLVNEQTLISKEFTAWVKPENMVGNL
jgi:hypothetical protein